MILRAFSELWTSYASQMADHLWQSTLFVVLAAILVLALRKNQGRVRYWVWLTASVKFLLPFSLLITLGSHLAKPRVSTPAQAVVYSAVEDFSQPFAGPELPLIPQAPAPVSRFHLLPPIIVAVWLAGIVAVLVVWAAGWIRVSLMGRRAVRLEQGPEVEALRRLESSFGVRTPIRLVLSRNWMEPGIFGILRPVLIWPEGIAQHLDHRHVEAILAHEICHARRHDNLTAVLHMLVEAVFWFHPLVWWMGARLEEERERACDEEVSLLCDQPHVYAESILRVCKFCSESPLACVSGITGADLKKRIVQIMTERVVRKLDLGRKALLLAVGLAVVAVPIVLGQAKAARRLMQAAIKAAPKPVQTAAHAMMANAPSMNAAVDAPPVAAPADNSAPSADDMVLGPAFEVATIRPANDPDCRHGCGFRLAPSGRLTVSAVPLEGLVGFSSFHYPRNSQVAGGPSWAESQKWDITAEIDPSTIPDWNRLSDDERMDRIKPMLLKLVIERFHLKIHTETRTYSVYTMVPAKGGVKVGGVLKRVDPPPARVDPQQMEEQRRSGKLPLGSYTMGEGGSWLFLSVKPYILAIQIAANCHIDGTVIDQSGLQGYYDLTFKPDHGPDASPLQDQVEEQLGLRFEPKKVPMPTYVIDSAEKPSVDGAEVAPAASVVPVAMAQEKAATTPTAPDHAIKFDIVSIRQNRSGSREMTRQSAADTDNITMTNVPLALVVFYAYWINDPNMILGVPDWAMTERYDVVAKVAPSDLAAYHALPNRQRAAMLQAVLADRFKLQVHHESKDSPVYALVVAKGGPKLKDAQPGEAHPDTAKANPNAFQHGATIFATGSNQITGEAARMGDLAVSLSTRGFEALGLGRPVIDKTGLTGRYDFVLQFPLPSTNASSTEGEDAPQESAASLSDALQDQLGLKLQPATAPTDYLVIDHIERPSEN